MQGVFNLFLDRVLVARIQFGWRVRVVYIVFLVVELWLLGRINCDHTCLHGCQSALRRKFIVLSLLSVPRVSCLNFFRMKVFGLQRVIVRLILVELVASRVDFDKIIILNLSHCAG